MTVQPPPASNRYSLDRRSALRVGFAGLSLAAAPTWAVGPGETGFTHGVASGEPGPDRALLWTRHVAAGGEARLRYEVAETLDFARVVAGGEAVASPGRDWCAKAVATGLEPGRWYYYRFVAPDGTGSPVGRTRTLPAGPVEKFRMAVFSCSNLGFGWFNAYRHAAEDAGFDLAVHTGDYYYEYQRGTYPSARQAVPGRVLRPDNEIVTLADYRGRHAAYRADRDLQRLFQLQPWIMVGDDHETANDSWKGGAENHQPATEGPWSARTAAAMRAYREWLPVSDAPWAAYEVGDLATLFRLETRITARDKPFDLSTLTTGTDAEVSAALARFRDGGWRDPRRTLLGAEQEGWLAAGLAASRRAGKPWQVLVQQVVMGELRLVPSVAEGMRSDSPDYVRRRIANGLAASRVGLPVNMDAWDGYPAARERLLRAAREADANLVVLTGDTHNAWAFELAHGNERAGVELAGHSVTSPGIEGSLPWVVPERFAADSVGFNPSLRWAEMRRRGYIAVELTPSRVSSEWRFLDTVKMRSTALSGTHRMAVEAGRNRFS
ncbi:MAG: alkaline phosphatase D family protein [Novosphingobium sp.]|nr:alkaline phosphatase D family protein [Novosphingobium sp.]